MKFKKFKLWFYGLLFCLLNWGCIQTIDLAPEVDFSNSIGISAKLFFNNYDEAIFVLSAVNSTYGDWVVLDDAFNFEKVSLENSSGQIKEIKRTGNGYYGDTTIINQSDFDYSPDLSFRIILNLENGETIYSEFESYTSSDIIKNIDYQIKPEWENIYEVKTVVDLDPSKVNHYYRIFPAETFAFQEKLLTPHNNDLCFIRSELFLDDFILISKNDDLEVFTGIVPYERNLDDLLRAQGFYLEILVESLSEGAFEYWTKAKKLLKRTGNMFDEAPGLTNTNLFSDRKDGIQAVGYFYVTEQKSTGKFFSVTDIQGSDEILPICPLLRPDRSYYPQCVDCTEIQGSTLKVPRYWPEEWNYVIY